MRALREVHAVVISGLLRFAEKRVIRRRRDVGEKSVGVVWDAAAIFRLRSEHQ